MNNLLVGLIQTSYQLPLVRLNAGFYLRGGVTPQKDGRHKTIMTGFTLDYQLCLADTINIFLASSLRADLVILFVKTSNASNKNLFLRTQASLKLGLDEIDLIDNYQLQFDIPVKFGLTGEFMLFALNEKSYELSISSGLNTKLIIHKSLTAQVGYSFR